MTSTPGRRPGLWYAAGVLLALSLAGCVVAPGRPVASGLLEVAVTRPLTIPPGYAHIKFQRGRQVRAVNRYEPWCELETSEVSDGTRRLEPERLSVSRYSLSFLKDDITRMPVLIGGWSCDDLVFQETKWWFVPVARSSAMYLRCLAPYTNCVLGPPLSPDQIQGVVGNALSIGVDAEG